MTDRGTWYEIRKSEIIKLYEENQFGSCPATPKDMTFKVIEKRTPAFDGKAIRRQVTVYFTKDTASYKMDLLIYLPINKL